MDLCWLKMFCYSVHVCGYHIYLPVTQSFTYQVGGGLQNVKYTQFLKL